MIGYKAGGKLRETVSPTCPTNAPDARSSFTVWLEFDDNEDGNWEEIPGSRRHGLLRHVGHCDGTTTNESSDGSASVEGVIAHTAELQVNKDYLVRLRIKLDRVLTSNETFESVPEQNTITLIEI